MIKTLLGFMTPEERKRVAPVFTQGWLLAPAISFVVGIPQFFIASAREWVVRGDDAMVEVGHDGCALPMSDPWRRR